MYTIPSREEMPSKTRSISVMTGLGCAPETGPKARMIATSAAPVAAAFSNSSRPVSPGLSRHALGAPATVPRDVLAGRQQHDDRTTGSSRVSVISGPVRAVAGLVAFTIAEWMPGISSCVDVMLTSVKPTAPRPSAYSANDSAPATHRTNDPRAARSEASARRSRSGRGSGPRAP
jgi:hypothetical protein